MGLPTISNYGKYSSDNYPHCRLVDMGSVRVWFSYSTPIAFTSVRVSRFRTFSIRVVRENDWGPTTGKHLNWIDGGDKDAKNRRVNSNTFERLWKERIDPILEDGRSAEANREFRIPVSV